MAVITLTSDFGLLDYRVSAIKGSIAQLDDNVKVIDITHEIDAYNLMQAAYIVRNAYRYFPRGSVHIISVDSFYRKEIKTLLYKADNHYFIAPDNGILELIHYDIKPELIYEITINNRFGELVTFPTIDISVPTAVSLCNGVTPDVVGRPFTEYVERVMPRPSYKTNEKIIVGEVIYIDNFGNIVSNISQDFFKQKSISASSYQIIFRNLSLSNIYTHYTECITDWSKERDHHGQPIAIFNDSGLLELSIYKGSKYNGASTLFGMSVGEKIYIKLI